jgi:hypothetical protein
VVVNAPAHDGVDVEGRGRIITAVDRKTVGIGVQRAALGIDLDIRVAITKGRAQDKLIGKPIIHTGSDRHWFRLILMK